LRAQSQVFTVHEQHPPRRHRKILALFRQGILSARPEHLPCTYQRVMVFVGVSKPLE